jgi:hypothetical protein
MTPRVIASVVALLALSAGIAYATIPDASSQYHACVLSGVGQVRIIDHDAGDNCKENEQHVHWNQSGAPGPTNLVIREGPVSDPGGTSVASCNAGERATGGGGSAFGAAPGNNGLRVSFPTPLVVGGMPTGWRVVGESQDTTVKAFVVCAS